MLIMLVSLQLTDRIPASSFPGSSAEINSTVQFTTPEVNHHVQKSSLAHK